MIFLSSLGTILTFEAQNIKNKKSLTHEINFQCQVPIYSYPISTLGGFKCISSSPLNFDNLKNGPNRNNFQNFSTYISKYKFYLLNLCETSFWTGRNHWNLFISWKNKKLVYTWNSKKVILLPLLLPGELSIFGKHNSWF